MHKKLIKEKLMALSINTPAPDFTIKNDRDEQVSLSNFKGNWIVLYFYPKDNTSGCTKEACDFNDNLSEFNQINAVILGVSPDSVKSHQNFKKKYNLQFDLLADTEKEVCTKYDVLGEKSMYGKKYMGVIRTTYIIDPQGIIRWVDPKVSVDGHAKKNY